MREQGPEHSKVFTVEVRVGKEWTGQADGRTKKIAAQRAARGVYERLREQAAAEAETAERNRIHRETQRRRAIAEKA